MTDRVELARSRDVAAGAERVWQWMCDTEHLELFHANVFHRHAECDVESLAVGSEIRIDHALLWRSEMRVATITELRPFTIAWSEIKATGRDWFPHRQRFEITEIDRDHSRVHNTLVGRFRLPGAAWWLVPWYRHVLPFVLDAENRLLARACERLTPASSSKRRAGTPRSKRP